MRPGPKLLVVDVDTGLDDAWALVVLLQAQRLGHLRLLAVTAASGNTNMENVLRNTCRVLQSMNAKHVPVYRGSVNVEIESNRNRDEADFFGVDGFGDVAFDCEPDMSQVQSQSGIDALVTLVAQHPGEISLVCLAPLSNIAQAMSVDSNFTTNLKEILIMGGDYSGPNAQGTAEYNFLKDPTAANEVLSHAKCPITILPKEPCLEIGLSRVSVGIGGVQKYENPTMEMIHKAEIKCWKAYLPNTDEWWECDLFLACAIVNERVVRRSVSTCARVQVTGSRRGQLILDPTQRHNVEIITELDPQMLKEEILKSAEM